jgi:hypothetical protein
VPPEEDGEQAARHGQADAFGLGRAGERGLLVLVEDHRVALPVGELLLGLAQAFLELVDLLLQLLLARLCGGAVDGVEGRLGLAVQALARDAALVGLLGDGAVAAEEGTSGAGEVLEGGYDRHG